MKQVELKEPIAKMLVGLNKAADAVTGTLGPKGRNAFIDDTVMPVISNDGKRIADSISLPDKFENMGAWVVRNTAAQTNDDAGDGTTTTTLLLQEIIRESLKRPENAMEVAASLKEALPGVLKAIKAKSQKVKDVYQVALTSTEDEELARIITDVVKEVGETGTILVEENNEPKLVYEVVSGYEAHVGYMSPYFVTNSQKMEAVFKDVAILCTEKKINSLADLQPIIQKMNEEKIKEIVIVCEDIDNSMLGILVASNIQRKFPCVVIRATGPLLEDISASVGATLISDKTGVTFENFEMKRHLGQAKKVVVTEKKSLFVSDALEADMQAERLEQFAKANPNKWEAQKAMERVAKLRGEMAVIRVGAPTTLAMNYLKDKADDAVHATQAALEEGVVEGGGMTLWRIAQEMKGKTIGEEILKKALTAPLRKICQNAGVDYTDIVMKLPEGKGYDAKTGMAVDMLEGGIVDPAKVERCAVQNAISNAAKFITTHVAIVDYVEPKV